MFDIGHRTSVKLRYAGRRVECPVCGMRWRRFAPHRGVPDRKCMGCGALERHRVMWLWLPERIEGQDVLHIAPEPSLGDRIRGLAASYVSADLESPVADEHWDVQRIPKPDESFDVVICNHVLEHVADDRRAMRELHRVLKAGGLAVLAHPIYPDLPVTFEDPSVVAPEDRLRLFGQEDHVRRYGQDFYERVKAAGFRRVERLSLASVASPEEQSRYGLADTSVVVGYAT